MWTFRKLEVTEYNLMEEAFEWYQSTPNILKVSWEWEDDLGRFIQDLEAGDNYVGYVNNVYSAMIHGQPKGLGVVEGHLFCLPGLEIDFIVAMVTYAKVTALKKYDKVLTATPVKHKTMLEINRRAGFIDTGVRGWNSVYRGKLLELQYNLAVK